MALPWTLNDKAVLKAMVERGDSPADISRELRRTANAISTMATRLGLKRPVREPLSATGHPLPVLFELETLGRIDKQSTKRSPYVRRAVDLLLAFDEAGIEGTPAELVARLRAAPPRTGRAEAGVSSKA